MGLAFILTLRAAPVLVHGERNQLARLQVRALNAALAALRAEIRAAGLDEHIVLEEKLSTLGTVPFDATPTGLAFLQANRHVLRIADSATALCPSLR